MFAAYAVAIGCAGSSNATKLTPRSTMSVCWRAGDDVAEPHAADGVGRQPRLHPDVDADAVERRPCGGTASSAAATSAGALAGDAGDAT